MIRRVLFILLLFSYSHKLCAAALFEAVTGLGIAVVGAGAQIVKYSLTKAAGSTQAALFRVTPETGAIADNEHIMVDNVNRMFRAAFSQITPKNCVLSAGFILGTYGTYALVLGGWRLIEDRMQAPSILLPNARVGLRARFKEWIWGYPRTSMIFPPTLAKQVEELLARARIVNKGDVGSEMGHANVLVLGDHSTGARTFGQFFADKAGMDYAPLAAGELVQSNKGVTGVNRLKEVVRKADQSARGLVIDIQGLDVLAHKNNPTLNYIGALARQKSKSFLIMASMRHPSKVVEGIFSDSVYMPMPDEEMRNQLIQHAFERYFLNQKKNKPVFIQKAREIITPQVVADTVRDTQGLSHGQIEHAVESMWVKACTHKLLTLDHIKSAVTAG